MPTQATTAAERLQHLNEQLTALGMVQINAQAAVRLGKLATRTTVRDMVRNARSDPNARVHLTNLIARARSMPPPDASESTSRSIRASTATGEPASHAPVPNTRQHEEPQGASSEPTMPTDARTAPVTSAPADRTSFHIYGGKGALTVEAAVREKNGKRQHVLYIDGAHATGPKVYDWKNKSMFMLLPSEIPSILAVLLGQLKKAAWKNHGEDSDKWLSVEHQGKSVFLKLGGGGDRKIVAVPIGPEDALQLAALLLRQMRGNFFGLAGTDILGLIRAAYVPMKAAASQED